MKETGPQDPGTPSGSSLAGKILSWPLEKVDPPYGAVGGVIFFCIFLGCKHLFTLGLGDVCPVFF